MKHASGQKSVRILSSTVLVLISTFLSLLLIEFFLSWDDRRPSLIGYENQFLLNGAAYTFLATDDDMNHHQGAIAIIGDSFTRGSACGNGRTYPSAFTRSAQNGPVPLHAINLGVDAAGPITYLRIVKDYLAEKPAPDGLIVTLYANDVDMHCWECASLDSLRNDLSLGNTAANTFQGMCRSCNGAGDIVGNVSYLRRAHWWLQDKSKTYRLAQESGVKLALASGVLEKGWGRLSFPVYWSNLENPRFMLLEAALGRIKFEADRLSVPMMVFIYPDVTNLNENNIYFPIYPKAAQHLSNAIGVPVYSGFDAFLKSPGSTAGDMSFSLVDGHPSCEAHAIFGEWVYDKWIETYGGSR